MALFPPALWDCKSPFHCVVCFNLLFNLLINRYLQIIQPHKGYISGAKIRIYKVRARKKVEINSIFLERHLYRNPYSLGFGMTVERMKTKLLRKNRSPFSPTSLPPSPHNQEDGPWNKEWILRL